MCWRINNISLTDSFEEPTELDGTMAQSSRYLLRTLLHKHRRPRVKSCQDTDTRQPRLSVLSSAHDQLRIYNGILAA